MMPRAERIAGGDLDGIRRSQTMPRTELRGFLSDPFGDGKRCNVGGLKKDLPVAASQVVIAVSHGMYQDFGQRQRGRHDTELPAINCFRKKGRTIGR